MKNIRMIMVVLLVIAMAPGVQAQKELPPEGSAPKDFKLPAQQTFVLDNGLNVTMVPYGTLPKVTVMIVVRAGNLNETEQEVWLADVTGELMKEGTTSRSGAAVAEEAASMGGAVNINVGPDLTYINGDVLSEFGPKLVGLMAEVVRHPLFPESELKRIKNDKIRQVTVAKSQPRSVTMEQFYRLLYPDHPYGRVFPTTAMLEGYTVENVKEFYHKNFGALRTSVYVAGRFDGKAMEQAIRGAFAGWERGPEPLIDIPKPSMKKAFHLIDRPGASQSTIYLGLPMINPADGDYIPMVVTNALLGGSFGSRITSNIREQKGYTYSPFSQISSRYRDAYWAEVADVTTNVTGPALKEIYGEITRLQQEPPSESELKGIQNYLAGTFVLQNSSRGGIINQLSFMHLHGLKNNYLTNYVKTVYSVTPQEVSSLTSKYIRPENMTLVIAGDKSAIEEQIEEYSKPAPEMK